MSDARPASGSQTLPPPGWARAADFAAILFAIYALTIHASGGMRALVWGWHVKIASPFRLLLFAAAIVVARHVLVQQPSMFRSLREAIVGWARSAPLRTAGLVAAGTRPVMFAVGYLTVIMLGYAPGAQPFHDFENELLNLPLRWDAGWYLGIATTGYSYIDSAGPGAQQNIVFFPAYPLIVRAVARLAGNSAAAYVVGATVTTVVLFVLALAYVYRLARERLTDDQAAATLWLLAAYPFSLFYGAIYTESLFLLGSAGAFYHFGRRELGRAALWGLLVGLTRPNGLLLSVPLAIAAIEGRGERPAVGARIRVAPAACAAIAMPVAGAAFYSAFIWRLAGNPFAWAAGHAAWGRHYQGLSHLVATRYGFIASAGLLEYVSREPYDLLNGLGVVFVLTAVWPVFRRFGPAYAAFILINILPPLAAGGLMSAGRFSSVLFPAFLWLGAAVPARHRSGWISTFAAIQAFNAALFYSWRPLF